MKEPVINVFDNVTELLNALADFLVKVANEAIEAHGQFTLALSGGNSPKKLYELLASSAYKNQVDWKKVYFFFGDERYVPADSLASNALMAKKTLFDPLLIPETNIFKVDTSLAPEESARIYLETIEAHFQDTPINFDLILLGLGDNAHTASLFPHTSVLEEKVPSVKPVFVDELNAYRITFTAPLINQARYIAFLVYGEDKAEAVHQILGEERDFRKYPAQLIQADLGSVYWFMDKTAAR